jgi:hypothetical protein
MLLNSSRNYSCNSRKKFNDLCFDGKTLAKPLVNHHSQYILGWSWQDLDHDSMHAATNSE